MKLTSISEHSDFLHNQPLKNMSERWELHRKRIEFGRQKLELWMFIPCKLVDGVWVVLEEPTCACETEYDREGCYEKCYEYINSKNKVLFEGFVPCITNRVQSVCHENCSVHFQLINKETIESISKIRNIFLTESAKKQIGL